MSQSADLNRRIVLAMRPDGAATPANFRLETQPRPTIKEGQILLRALHVSVDPYIRGRMDKVRSYTKPIDVGGVIFSAAICEVAESRHHDFRVGELLLSYTGWQDYAVSDGVDLLKLDPKTLQPSHALGILGLPGFTAYVGLNEIGEPKPGETLVVGAATGGVGSAVGQMAKIKGCRVIGIAGGTEKCEYAVRELGFDACINHHDEDLLWQLRENCPKGIDIYFENIGGPILDAVMPQLNPGARIPLCGLMSYYNQNKGDGVDRTALILSSLLVRRVRMQGFIVFDHFDHYGDKFMRFFNETRDLVSQGRIKVREDRLQGLEAAPHALIGILRGDNFGKVVVDVGAISS